MVNALADGLIEDLRREVPGPGKHPNATGNLLDSLTTRSAVYVIGNVWWVGVGDMSRLGTPGEKAYRQKPIKRFLDWYLEREEARHERRRAEQRRLASERAARARQRDRAVRRRAARQERREFRQYVQEQIRNTQALIARLNARIDMLEDRLARLATYSQNYSIYFERAESKGAAPGERGWDLSRKSYQVKYRKWETLKQRQRDLRRTISEIEQRVARYEEGLMLYRRRWE